jgi:hypothetical protein
VDIVAHRTRLAPENQPIGKITWRQNAAGIHVDLPADHRCDARAARVSSADPLVPTGAPDGREDIVATSGHRESHRVRQAPPPIVEP